MQAGNGCKTNPAFARPGNDRARFAANGCQVTVRTDHATIVAQKDLLVNIYFCECCIRHPDAPVRHLCRAPLRRNVAAFLDQQTFLYAAQK